MKKLEREGGLTGLLDFTVIRGCIMKIDVSVDPFSYIMDLILDSKG